jgi:hypothetical protein
MMRTTTEFLQERLGEDRIVVLDGECVDHVSHYEEVLRDLVRRVSSGRLALTHFVGVEGTPRRITLALDGGEPLTFEAEGATDWLDSAAVIAAMNRMLAARGEVRQLVEYQSDEFGQESGWVLLTPSELEALLEYGLTENREVGLCFGDGMRLSPVSEDRGGDGPEPWEDAILGLDPGGRA